MAWAQALEHIDHNWGQTISPDITAWGTAVDYNTVSLYKQLRQSIISEVERTGEPVPAVKYIKPTIIAMWNKEKPGVDVKTRQLKHVQVPNESQSPQQYFFDRYLKMVLLNVHALAGAVRIYPDVRDEKIKSFHQYRARMASHQGAAQDFMARVGLHVAKQLRNSGEVVPEHDGKFVPDTFKQHEPRLVYFSKQEPREHRLTGVHRRIELDSASCALCSGTFEYKELKGSVAQKAGGRSKFACLECGNVHLCKDSRYSIRELSEAGILDAKNSSDDKDASAEKHQDQTVSCWTLWHTQRQVQGIHEFLFNRAKLAKITAWRDAAEPPQVSCQSCTLC